MGFSSSDGEGELASGAGGRAELVVASLFALLLALPTLVFRYLPMTDLPQHVAISAILGGLSDPSLGFADCYVAQPWRTPYLLPYALAIGTGRLLGLEAAWRLVTLLSVASYLVAVLLWLRRLRKPLVLLALAAPLVYHRAFFWGFVAFDLAIGLALIGMALLGARPGWRRTLAISLLLLAMAVSHVYGLLLFLAGGGLEVLLGERAERRAKGAFLALATALLVPWAVTEWRAPPLGGTASPPLLERLRDLPSQVLGGYRDASEPLLLALLAVAFLALTWRRIPVTPARWRALPGAERALWCLFAGNAFLYLVLPRATPTAKFINFRHAVIAALLLPALAGWELWERSRLVGATLLLAVGGGGGLSAWDHLRLFDAEARTFDRAMGAMPDRPRLLGITLERNGNLMLTNPYLHFGAYAQARRGGVFSMGFPEVFWNVPVRVRSDCGMPPTPVNFEWRPRLPGPGALAFYDTVLVRSQGRDRIFDERAPYQLVFDEPPWQVYRRRER